MPVKCKLIEGKWRLVGPGGKMEHKAKHDTKESCMKQAAAINAETHAIAYSMEVQDTVGVGELMYSKELIYVGQFEKDDMQFEVTADVLHHWVMTFNEMMKNGIEVPVPVEHTIDPEKRRGTVRAMVVKENSRGVPALFGLIEFRDKEAAKLAETAQVSVYVPPEFTDGKGTTYKRPIRHVALTDYPVIPKLDEFEAIAASYVPTSKEEPKMALSEFARNLTQKLGLEFLSDEDVEAAVLAKFAEDKKAAKAAEPPKEGEEKEGGEEEEEEEEEMSESSEEKPIAASFITLLKDNRTMKLSQLVSDGKITKAQKDDLIAEYCDDNALTLSLQGTDDKFDLLVKTLSKNPKTLKDTEKTGPQSLALSADNPLIKDAEARAKAFNSR